MNDRITETLKLARRMAREERRLAAAVIRSYGRAAWLAWRADDVFGFQTHRAAVARLIRACRAVAAT